MPRQDDDDRKQRQAIDSRSSVLRAMLRSGWIDSETDSILPDAYYDNRSYGDREKKG